MTSYLVTWQIELDAENETDAALQAHEIQQDPDSEATVFSVQEVGKPSTVDYIDLRGEWEF